jgi:putative endonuclease
MSGQAFARPRRSLTASMSDAWVYILRCADGSLYTGWTVDVERRLASHRAGRGARYTRSRLPVELLATFAMDDAQADQAPAARAEAGAGRRRPSSGTLHQPRLTFATLFWRHTRTSSK